MGAPLWKKAQSYRLSNEPRKLAIPKDIRLRLGPGGHAVRAGRLPNPLYRLG